MKVPSSVTKLCPPAMLYLVVSVILIVIAVLGKFNAGAIVMKVIFVLIWTWFLNFLCSKGYQSISWFLVLIPYIFMFLMLFLAIGVVHKMKVIPPPYVNPPRKN
jgi:hypothetical protein